MKSLLADEYERLGFEELEGDSVLERAHRIHILDWACRFDYSDCMEKAIELFSNWMNETSEENP